MMAGAGFAELEPTVQRITHRRGAELNGRGSTMTGWPAMAHDGRWRGGGQAARPAHSARVAGSNSGRQLMDCLPEEPGAEPRAKARMT